MLLYDSNILPITIAIGLILLSYHFVRTLAAKRVRRSYGHCRDAPTYPHKDPILGLDGLRDSIRAGKANVYLQREQRLHETYGNTFTSIFVGETVLNTIEPDNIKTVLSTKFEIYGIGARRKRAFEPLLGNSIFQNDGAPWESSRGLLRSVFQRVQADGIALLEPHVSNLMRVIPKDCSTIDMSILFHRLVADIATDFLFGDSIRSLEDPAKLSTGVLKAIHDSQSGCETRWLLGSLASLVPQPTFNRNVRTVHAYIQKYVDKAVGQNGPKPDDGRDKFIDLLTLRTRDPVVLRDELLTLYLAGSDAVAALLINLLFMVAKQPTIWQHLRKEVRALNGQWPRVHDLKRFRYVKHCIFESLRLHPVQPGNSRVALQDTVLPKGGGEDGSFPVFVPKGTMVHFSTYALHRRPDLWGEDAEDFNPDRWEDNKLTWKFIPFLGGPRNCIGQDFAMQEASYVLIRLVQEFKSVESKDPQPWVEGLSLACMSKNGAHVVMIPDSEAVR